MTDSPTSDFLPLDEIAALGRRRWRGQRRYAAGQSRFFRDLWSGIEPPERLEDLPRLPLADKSMLRRSQAETPPFGDYLAAPEDRVARLHRTGGTTGQAMNLALGARDARQTASGLGPGHRVVHCLNYRLWMGGFSDHTTLEATGACHLDAEGAMALETEAALRGFLDPATAERIAGFGGK